MTLGTASNLEYLVISRRKFLKRSSEVGVAFAATGTGLGTMLSEPSSPSAAGDVEVSEAGRRAQQSFEIRCDSARGDTRQENPAPATNGDEERYGDKRANFAKTLPHDELGEVKLDSYAAWISILAGGDPGQFERIPRDPLAVAKLNDPQATYAFDMVGIDSHATHLPPPPAFASAEMAVEMAELYWLTLTADLPFQNYEASPLITAALSDLTPFRVRWAQVRRERSPLEHYFAVKRLATSLGPISASSYGSIFPTVSKPSTSVIASPGATSISLPILPPGWPANEAPSPPPSSSSTRRRGASAAAGKLSNMCIRILAFKPM